MELNDAINNRNLEKLKKIYEKYPYTEAGLNIATNEYHQNIEITKFLSPLYCIEHGTQCLKSMLTRNLDDKDMEIIKILINDGIQKEVLLELLDRKILITEIFGKVFNENPELRLKYAKNALYETLEVNDFDSFKKVAQSDPKLIKDEFDNILSLVIPKDNMELIKFLLTFTSSINDKHVLTATRLGLLQIFEILAPKELSVDFLMNCITEAAIDGNKDMVSMLHIKLWKSSSSFQQTHDFMKTQLTKCIKDSHEELFEYLTSI